MNAGSDVVVLEARARPGGRVEQTRTAAGRVVQFGGQWRHPDGPLRPATNIEFMPTNRDCALLNKAEKLLVIEDLRRRVNVVT
ncbi:hypothetical protein E3T25_06305 [Cryobacterium sandaracinum]|uniref:Amine oxidase domain-containing protein n=1 Tax=Cryobacterium sandaracinum TaxID=1259247 RepID=A0ABY2JIL1_9MICO|nr:hypothetical protein E3T25_06305 [Cryobacterium sandaracinum]